MVNPLNDDNGLDNIGNNFAEVEALCNSNGRILILQDKFSDSLIKKIARKIGQSCKKNVLTQKVYSESNENSVYTYSYYRCLFDPCKIYKKVQVA